MKSAPVDLLQRMHARFEGAKADEDRRRAFHRPKCFRCPRPSSARRELRDSRAVAFVRLCELHLASFRAGELVALSSLAEVFEHVEVAA